MAKMTIDVEETDLLFVERVSKKRVENTSLEELMRYHEIMLKWMTQSTTVPIHLLGKTSGD